jgi:hypothetical protein
MPNATAPSRPSIVMALCASMSLGTLAMTGPARADFLDGVSMMTLCKPFIDNPKDPIRSACVMYILGNFEALHLWNPFWTNVCTPKTLSPSTLAFTVLDYAKGHPKELGQYAGIVITEALRQAYPCRPGEHQPLRAQ